ncbi:MAG: hypothetical protein VX498_14140 [Myxococcota bacterium]|nr:hypothetical protein [Myxococcota bacterium]
MIPTVSRLLTQCALIAVLALSFVGLAWAVPSELNHQGRLLDADGLPVEGELPVTFSLEDAAGGGLVIWSETLTVAFDNGYFSVILGSDPSNPLDADVLAGEPLWLGVSVDGGDQLQPLQPVVSAPYSVLSGQARNLEGGLVNAAEVQIEGSTVIDSSGNWVGPEIDHEHPGTTAGAGVPLGTIIDWWRPNETVPLPEGYAVCDGSVIDDPQSPWLGETLPDLLGRVALGIELPELGQIGGSSIHEHENPVGSHVHDMDHAHGLLTGVSASGGSQLTEDSNMAVTGSAGAQSTGGPSLVATDLSGASTTLSSNNPSTDSNGSAYLTSSSNTASTPPSSSASTGGPNIPNTTSTSGDSDGPSTVATASAGTGTTGPASSSSTGGGSGSTGSASSSSTGSGGVHQHKTFRYDAGSARNWYTYNSSGNEQLMLDTSSNAGLSNFDLGEDVLAPGRPVSSSDFTSYTQETGSHSHSQAHTHSTTGHSHSQVHTHPGPGHSHDNDHSHGLSGHSHSIAHNHAVAGHSHDLAHDHYAPAHTHGLGHDHDIPAHDHAMEHSHTPPEHEHGLDHDHALQDHDHGAGSLAVAPYTGSVSGSSNPSSTTSGSSSSLPPYVGVLKLMRIR